MKSPAPSQHEILTWFRSKYGMPHYLGKELPLFLPDEAPRWFKPTGSYYCAHEAHRFELMQSPRIDYALDKHGIVYLCETDNRVYASSIGQLSIYRKSFPLSYPSHKTKSIRCLLFVYFCTPFMKKHANNHKIRVIILPQP